MKILKIILLIFLFNNCFYSQVLNKKWVVIKDNAERTLYIDQNNINKIDNQISIWSLKVFKNPTELTKTGKVIGKVKSQYIINSITNKFSLIGSIQYDEIGRIINDAAVEANEPQNEPIQTHDDILLLYNKAREFLRSGSITEVQMKNDDETELDSVSKKDTLPVEVTKSEVVDGENPFSKDGSGEIMTFKPAKPVNKIVDSKEGEIAEEKEKNKDLIVFEGTSKKKDDYKEETLPEIKFEEKKEKVDQQTEKPEIEEKYEYDASNERIARGTIFTDGVKYCIQLSSWKTKSKAEAQVKKYKNKGYDAFMVEAYISRSRGTWYRVRVGYYDSLEEAEKIQKEIK